MHVILKKPTKKAHGIAPPPDSDFAGKPGQPVSAGWREFTSARCCKSSRSICLGESPWFERQTTKELRGKMQFGGVHNVAISKHGWGQHSKD